MKKFRVADIVDHLEFEQGIYLLPMSGRGKSLLLSFLENVSVPYLWDNWEDAEPILDEVRNEMTTDVEPILQEIVRALNELSLRGGGGGSSAVTLPSLGSGCGCAGSGTLPLPEVVTSGDYEGTGGVPDYTEEDSILGAGGSDKCRKAHFAANWIANLVETWGVPDPSVTDAVALNAIGNQITASNTLNTYQKLLPGQGTVVIDGATGNVIQGARGYVGKAPRGGTLQSLFVYILAEIATAVLRGELGKWTSNRTVVGDIIGSANTYSELMDGLREAGLVQSPLSVRRFLTLLVPPIGILNGIGDVMGAICTMWWIAIQKGWEWFPSEAILEEMFPDVDCDYDFSPILITRYRFTLAPDVLTPDGSGGNGSFDHVQFGGGHSAPIYVCRDKRIAWELVDTSQETGDYLDWRVRLYEYLPPYPEDTTDLRTWLNDNIDDYPPSYEFMLDDFVNEDILPAPFALRGYIYQVSSGTAGGTLSFRVENV